MHIKVPLILASGSPRRKRLLQQLGLDFDIQVSDVDESFEADMLPADVVEQVAERKALAISPGSPGSLTLAADTIVVLNGQILGKPGSIAEATATLRSLSSNQHAVYTGLALSHPASKRMITAHEKTTVHFGQMSDSEINAYVASGSPMDKAGAYGIQDDQGALFVSHIEGDFYNVVGLPLHRLYQLIKREFADLLAN